MFSAGEFRKEAVRCGDLANTAVGPERQHQLRVQEQSFTRLADNEEWLSSKHEKSVAAVPAWREGENLAQEEEHVLRCLGAALILQWHTLPRELQRELFDGAGSMGEVMSTADLRGQIARFIHAHKPRESPGTR
jgi:hypothetical protein